jgi:hypothetical protein
MIAAQVWVDVDGDEQHWGAFEFVQLPSAGDLIWIVRQGGSYELRVLHIVHLPDEVGQPTVDSRTRKAFGPVVKVASAINHIREKWEPYTTVREG